jgi:hypothetical protein
MDSRIILEILRRLDRSHHAIERFEDHAAEVDPEALGLDADLLVATWQSFHRLVTAPLTQRVLSLPLQVISKGFHSPKDCTDGRVARGLLRRKGRPTARHGGQPTLGR